MTQEKVQATGRRKTAVARIFLSEGKGIIRVNGRALEDYFPTEILRVCIRQPLVLTQTADKFDVSAKVDGGGNAGQAQAIRLGIARALIKADEAKRGILKTAGFLMRDPREKERKKYGQKGARRKFQWTKR